MSRPALPPNLCECAGKSSGEHTLSPGVVPGVRAGHKCDQCHEPRHNGLSVCPAWTVVS